mgnify:CR=1 FL=1
MKKAMKKLMAALLAVAMVCAMAIPAWAASEDITNHSFSAFQIFKGDVDSNTLSNVAWGTGIKKDELLKKLTTDLSTYFPGITTTSTAAEVAAKMNGWTETDAKTTAFAKAVSECLADTATYTSTSSSIHFDDAGYYLIKDTTDITPSGYTVANISLLKVTDANSNVYVTSKVEKPTVTKQVEDNDDGVTTGDNDGFGSSADHAIGEVFRFKLTANVPSSTNNSYDFYKYYKVVFSDTMIKGLTFDEIESVTIESGSDNKSLIEGTDYTKSTHPTTNSFELTIADVKKLVTNLNNGATITVLYKAHLNEEAIVTTATGSTGNWNKVSLQYSNNPNVADSFDTTPYEEVYVFTYQLNNTKRQDSETGDVLEGAGFRLYSAATCNDAEEIKLKKNTDGTYSRYFGADAGDEMFSDDKGQFNVKGLDAGTYYLKETSTPTGFNTCPVTTVTIKANHTKNHVDLTDSTMSTTIVNNHGTTLPGTGGIGTTIFYVVGGGLMVAAGVLLITKKRMENR